MGTDKYQIQVYHHLRGVSNEYDQYVVFLAILNHGWTNILAEELNTDGSQLDPTLNGPC